MGGQSPPPIENITHTQSLVNKMLFKLGIFLIIVGLIRLIVALIIKARNKEG